VLPPARKTVDPVSASEPQTDPSTSSSVVETATLLTTLEPHQPLPAKRAGVSPLMNADSVPADVPLYG